MSVKKNLDYIIVLGAHVDGTRMTLALLERARRALLYLEENPGTKAVLSGGKGDGENISEAEAMYRYLTGHGINGDRLMREEESTSTKEKGFMMVSLSKAPRFFMLQSRLLRIRSMFS